MPRAASDAAAFLFSCRPVDLLLFLHDNRPYHDGVEAFSLRFGEPDDVAIILEFVQDLADYGRLSHECVATEASLQETLFGDHPYAEVVLGFAGDQPAGFALFFHSYSTFLAKPGIYMEDLFVKPEWRGRGFGRELLIFLARVAVERGCGRLEWAVLDWNVDAIRFYESIGADPLDAWTTMRVSGSSILGYCDWMKIDPSPITLTDGWTQPNYP